MKGRLEREIRLLPHVLACSLSDQDAFVLIAPSADPAGVEQAVARLQVDAGDRTRLHVMGGRERTAAAALRPGAFPVRSRVGLAGIALTGLLAASSLVGGIRIERERTPDSPRALPPVTAAGPAETLLPKPERPEELEVGDARAPASEPRPEADIVFVAGRPQTNHTLGAQVPAEPVPTEPDAAEETRSCGGPPDRGAPRARSGRAKGDGPPAWSRSVLVALRDLCEHGR